MKNVTLVLTGTINSDAAEPADIGAEIAAKVESTKSAAAALVESLREAGVNIQTGSVAFAPRAGVHGATETVDLTAAPVQDTSPQPSPQGGEGEGAAGGQ